MMPPLTTPVKVPPLPLRLDFDSVIVSLGSCFADEMAYRLLASGFRMEQNPFGTLYNPASIALAVERIIDCHEITENDLVQHEGLWHSWYHHGSFSRPTVAETLEACNRRLHQAHEAFRSACLLTITFGTAWVFEKTDSDQWAGACGQKPSLHNGTPITGNRIVANCHKLPASMFKRRMMTIEEIVALWQPLLNKIANFNSRLSILFTVSPIRHLADGAHGNQLSKATLLLATDMLCSACDNTATHYFPAYEIVLDELRDYRFFGPDMTHLTALAADIVYDRFQQATMTPAVIQQAHNNAKAARRQQHIPLH